MVTKQLDAETKGLKSSMALTLNSFDQLLNTAKFFY